MSEARSGSQVEISNLEFEFEPDGFRLRMPELTIASGERIACVGPSGSGKSTFLALLAGILSPNRGRIEVDGENWSELGGKQRRSRRLERVGFVFQEFELLEHLSVRENILMPSWLSKSASRPANLDGRADELAKAAGIGALLKRAPSHLSQGERQRTAICRALTQRPALLLADEPTGNLDESTSRSIRELLFEDSETRGTTLIVVTHDLNLADEFDRVLDFAGFIG